MRSGCFAAQFCLHKLIQTMLILLVVSPTLAGYGWLLPASRAAIPAPPAPQFDTQASPASRRLSILAGQTALLPCVVRNLGDKVVSWIRNGDLHILTSGIFVFTSDTRFEVIHRPNIDFWGLQIKNTQLSDSGKYECQVNTDPKMNYPVQLSVTDSHMHDSPMDEEVEGAEGVEGVAWIQGPGEQTVRVGATITFTCVASRTTRQARAQLKWTHAGRDVTFQSHRGGISVDTAYRDQDITSSLTVAMVTPSDAGAYTCRGHGFYVAPASVLLHVQEGERSEAIQRPPSAASSSRGSLFTLLFVYFNWILR